MKYTIIRTEKADICIQRIVMYIAKNFGKDVALKKLDELEKNIMLLESDPNLGTVPKYPILKRQGYKVLILKKDLVFYEIDENNKQIIIYAVVDQRQDYLNIINGL